MPRNTQPTPREVTVDCVLVTDESGDFSGAERCLSCEQRFEENEAVVRLRDHLGLVDFLVHRRCIEFLLKKAPVDGDTADKEFQRYRRKLAKRYA